MKEQRANGTSWSRIEIALPVNRGAQLLQRDLDSFYAESGEEVEIKEKLHEWL